MEIIRRINDDLAIAGMIAVAEWRQVAEEGFQSVLDLRSLDKPLLDAERDYVESRGLCYVNLPSDIDMEFMNVETALALLQQIDVLPKPTLVCNNATLAAAMVLMYIAMRQGETLQQAFQRAEKIGLFRVSMQAVVTPSAT